MKRKNGITLIALIITIIVMLILAGVSISLVVGDNGVISQAQGTKEEQRIAEIKEAIETYKASKKIEEYTETKSTETLEEYLISQGLVKSEEIKNGKITIGNTVIEISNKDAYYSFSLNELNDGGYLTIGFKEKNDCQVWGMGICFEAFLNDKYGVNFDDLKAQDFCLYLLTGDISSKVFILNSENHSIIPSYCVFNDTTELSNWGASEDWVSLESCDLLLDMYVYNHNDEEMEVITGSKGLTDTYFEIGHFNGEKYEFYGRDSELDENYDDFLESNGDIVFYLEKVNSLRELEGVQGFIQD